MSAFDKIIGYDHIKDELMQIADMLQNKSAYEKLGAKMPRGLLIYGHPGLGKSLMADCLIEASTLPCLTVRRSHSTARFIEHVDEVFRTAKEKAPAIVLLDDMDKFANEDETHRNAKEYVAIQEGIDDVRDTDVFVIATANNLDVFPDSLIRAGRFDKKIEIRRPHEKDAKRIIRHFMNTKRISESVCCDDISKMLAYRSCAELENILNEAAITAAFAKRSAIAMEDIVKAVLKIEYKSPEIKEYVTEEERRATALHEAGHVVVSELLCPQSVGMASIRANYRWSVKGVDGFIFRCKGYKDDSHYILAALAGKAATELYHCGACADGCNSDLHKAFIFAEQEIILRGTLGLGLVNVHDSIDQRTDAVIHAEVERCMFTVRGMLMKNKEFLEKVADALAEKETLLFSEIQAIKESVTIAA